MPEALDPGSWLRDHGDYLYRYALFRARDPHQAEDLVQDTLLAAIRARERFKGDSSVRTWLTGILNHKYLDQLRKQVRERVEENSTLDRAEPEAEPSSWNADPAALLERKEFRETFHDCLTRLNRRMFEAYSLREIDNLETDIICNQLGVTATNLRVTLHRAREQLRICLEKNWFGRHKQVAGRKETAS